MTLGELRKTKEYKQLISLGLVDKTTPIQEKHGTLFLYDESIKQKFYDNSIKGYKTKSDKDKFKSQVDATQAGYLIYKNGYIRKQNLTSIFYGSVSMNQTMLKKLVDDDYVSQLNVLLNIKLGVKTRKKGDEKYNDLLKIGPAVIKWIFNDGIIRITDNFWEVKTFTVRPYPLTIKTDSFNSKKTIYEKIYYLFKVVFKAL